MGIATSCVTKSPTSSLSQRVVGWSGVESSVPEIVTSESFDSLRARAGLPYRLHQHTGDPAARPIRQLEKLLLDALDGDVETPLTRGGIDTILEAERVAVWKLEAQRVAAQRRADERVPAAVRQVNEA